MALTCAWHGVIPQESLKLHHSAIFIHWHSDYGIFKSIINSRFTGQQAKTLSGFRSMVCHRSGTHSFTPQAGRSFRVNVRTDHVYSFQKLQLACFPYSPSPVRFRISDQRSRCLRPRHYRDTQTIQPQEIMHINFVSAIQFQDRSLPVQPPLHMQVFPRMPGTAPQIRTSVKPYDFSTHLQCF